MRAITRPAGQLHGPTRLKSLRRRVEEPRRQLLLLSRSISSIHKLKDASAVTFRSDAFDPAQPALLPRGSFASSIPAIAKWFQPLPEAAEPETSFNTAYLNQHWSAQVPVEITVPAEDGTVSFERIQTSLGSFVALSVGSQHRRPDKTTPRAYIAQHPIRDFPAQLQEDLPTPDIVASAGQADFYDSSVWLGLAPTYTPLHKDPNPNLFVQLAGKKAIRIFEPAAGREIFHAARTRSGSRGAESMRGEEMMQGRERQVLESLVWGRDGYEEDDLDDEDDPLAAMIREHALKAVLRPGDAIFIPKGWWHTIRSVGTGVIGSANWWFR